MHCFGPFRLDRDGVLWRGAEGMQLAPKPHALLRALLEANGALVPKHELLARVWPDEEVNEETLTQCVRSLRVALGDTARPARTIGTVYGRGYRVLVSSRRTTPGAYETYLQARFLWDRRAEPYLTRAIHLFERALELDPTYAAALGGIADCHVMRLWWGYVRPAEARRPALEAARRALALDPELPAAHMAIGWLEAFVQGDFARGEASLRRAVEADPAFLDARIYLGHVLLGAGRIQEALDVVEAGIEADPQTPGLAFERCYVLLCARRYAELLEIAAGATGADPANPLGHVYVALAASLLGRHAEAAGAARRAAERSGGLFSILSPHAYALARAGARDEARRTLAEIEEAARTRYVTPTLVAPVAFALGDTDGALGWLERARSEGCVWLPMAAWDPRFDALRGDPRFVRAMRRGARAPAARPVESIARAR